MSELILPEPGRVQNQEAFLRFVASDVKKHQTYRKEMDVMRSDGSIFPVEITLREVDLVGQRLVTTYFRDLTAQRNADREILRQREILQRNEKLSALGALLAGVAHELNNPLSVVVGQAQLLRETEQEPRVLKRAGKIAQAADRCAKVVSTFLAMARQKPPQRTYVNLNEVVEDALSLLEYGLRSRGIQLTLSLQPELPLLQADSDQLHQVVTNLVINAQHALQDVERRELNICTRLLSDSSLQLVVTDSGPGVPEEIRNRIFEPFFTTKSMGVGTGLGLSVCNGIIEAHGGSLSLADAEGGGACFTVTLVPESQTENQGAPANTEHQVIQRPLTIVVVDDEPEILELVNENLANAGHKVFCTSTGTELLEIIEEKYPDIILSDFRMPVMNGPDIFAAAIQRWPALAERFIFMTGDVLTTDSANFLQELDLPVLEKPFTAEQLHKSIYNTLQRGDIPL
jgi:signal transduction histidine kinase